MDQITSTRQGKLNRDQIVFMIWSSAHYCINFAALSNIKKKNSGTTKQNENQPKQFRGFSIEWQPDRILYVVWADIRSALASHKFYGFYNQ